MVGHKKDRLGKIRTGSLERRWSLARAGFVAGTRMVARSAGAMLTGQNQAQRRDILSQEAELLVYELGKLKGSVVKVGQMMALYGEHFLPDEITRALHTLENRTVAMEWSVVRGEFERQLGKRVMAELDIDPEPLAAASLGQVHRASRRSDGAQLCLKLQYPGVADAIDSDINAVARMLRLSMGLKRSAGFFDWVEDVREMLHAEVDYQLESEQTQRFYRRLKSDNRYAVPRVYPQFSGKTILATRYEPGLNVADESIASLDQSRRNELGRMFLDLFFREVFEWGEMQTDPNFGNYLIRPRPRRGVSDKIVLLDFAAVRKFPNSFLESLKQMIRGAYRQDMESVRQGALGLNFIREDDPEEAQLSFVRICSSVIEPLIATPATVPAGMFNRDGQYKWGASDLPERVAKEAGRAVLDKNFRLPAREFMFLNRKLIGVYTFIALLGAEFNGADIIEKYI